MKENHLDIEDEKFYTLNKFFFEIVTMSYLYKRHDRGEDNVTMDDIPKDGKDYRYAHNEHDAYGRRMLFPRRISYFP